MRVTSIATSRALQALCRLPPVLERLSPLPEMRPAFAGTAGGLPEETKSCYTHRHILCYFLMQIQGRIESSSKLASTHLIDGYFDSPLDRWHEEEDESCGRSVGHVPDAIVLSGGKRLRSAFMYYGYVGRWWDGNRKNPCVPLSVSSSSTHSSSYTTISLTETICAMECRRSTSAMLILVGAFSL
jgi:hypothetical protein